MLVPGANTGILVSRRNRSSETKHEWPGRQGAGARSGRETGFEKSLSPPKTHKRDTDLPQCFSSGDSGTTRKWVAGGVRAGLDRSEDAGGAP